MNRPPMNPLCVAALVRRLAGWLLAVLLVSGALAHEGHDHGAPPVPATPLAPRAAASSELFEVLAVAQPGGLRLYLDHYASNAPVAGATLEVEGEGGKWQAQAAEPGTYSVAAPALAAPGRHALSLTITAGEDVDLLALELEVPAAAASHAVPGGMPEARAWWPWAAGAAGVLLVGGVALARGRRGQGATLAGALLTIALAADPEAARAHGGEDHSHAAPAAGAAPAGAVESPSRLSDGSVFLPKPAQRALGVRTEAARQGEHLPGVELRGTVIADPSAGGRVQAPFAGRLEAPPGGLPGLGVRVRRGQVLGWLEPVASALERAGARERLAELEAGIRLAERRAARLAELEGSVPAREIESARVEAAALRERRQALAGGVSGREALRAPVDGVVAGITAVAGQVVDARETLFEVVDPGRLMVEAMAWNVPAAGLGGRAGGRLADGTVLELQPAGVGRVLQNQALPVRFRVVAPPATLAVGAPVTVTAGGGKPLTGVALPAAAVGAGGMVWLHAEAERFVSRRVAHQTLEAGRVLVTEGLGGGERVVVQGANLLDQVR